MLLLLLLLCALLLPDTDRPSVSSSVYLHYLAAELGGGGAHANAPIIYSHVDG